MSLPGRYIVPGTQDAPPTNSGSISSGDIQWAIDQFKRLAPDYSVARNYYDGNHPLNFATRKFNQAFGHLFQEFADNLCPVIVETVSDRLKISGFTAGTEDGGAIVGAGVVPATNGGGAPAKRAPGARPEKQSIAGSQQGADAGGNKEKPGQDPASMMGQALMGNADYMSLIQPVSVPESEDQKRMRRIWTKNQMKVRSGDVHLDALIEGDAYLIVWPDTDDSNDGIPYMYPNRATCVTVRYDEERPGRIQLAAKMWKRDDGFVRLNLYYTDRLEKYVTIKPIRDNRPPDKAAKFQQFRAEVGAEAESSKGEDGYEPWPVTYDFGRVPVFHFPNRASIGMLGKSELVEGIPIQNGLNKSVCDLLVAMEFRAVQQRWVAGLEEEKPGENRASKYPIESGGVWAFADPNAKAGEFQAADLAQFVVVIEMFSKHMARATRTPLHYFTLEGAMPSGESFKTAEAPLIAKIDKRQGAWGGVWEEAIRFAMKLMNSDAQPHPQIIWENTEPRNESMMVDNAIKKVSGLGMSATQGMRELGYSDAVIVADRAIKIAERLIAAASVNY